MSIEKKELIEISIPSAVMRLLTLIIVPSGFRTLMILYWTPSTVTIGVFAAAFGCFSTVMIGEPPILADSDPLMVGN
jgi:hypothetical protein